MGSLWRLLLCCRTPVPGSDVTSAFLSGGHWLSPSTGTWALRPSRSSASWGACLCVQSQEHGRKGPGFSRAPGLQPFWRAYRSRLAAVAGLQFSGYFCQTLVT